MKSTVRRPQSTDRIFAVLIGLVFLSTVDCGLSTASVQALSGNVTVRNRTAFVERVVDGDTVVLSTKERVRYIGMNTPELHHPKKPVEAYAREAKEFNRRLVERKRVRLEFDVEHYDKYGRLLAYVFLEDGTFVNAQLLEQGYAQLLTIPPNVKYVELFVRLQREAREANRGLWGRR